MKALQELESGAVHLWHVDPTSLDDAETAGLAGTLLAPEERDRAQRYRSEDDRCRCVVTRALVRLALSSYADVDPQDWAFEDNEHGRPMVTGPAARTGLHFSVSHTHDYVALLVGDREEIGVDVETLARQVEPLALARRYFAPSETELLEALPEADRHRLFLQMWTLKEAYGKALSRGLTVALDGLVVNPASEGRFVFSFNPSSVDSADAWQLRSWQPGGQHLLATAVRRESHRRCEIVWKDATGLLRDG